MRILLDTHVLLWIISGDSRVQSVEDEILADHTEIFVSTVSLWEVAIKVGVGKLDIDLRALRRAVVSSGFTEPPVKGEHTEALLKLPPVHKDPFDRVLIAQAISEPMKLMTADSKMEAYSPLVWKI